MKRNALNDLMEWKNSADRKPLVLRGGRQVGKTWLMKEFGSTCYSNYVYFNFDEDEELKSLFASNKNPHRLLELLALAAGEKISPETTLIIGGMPECVASWTANKDPKAVDRIQRELIQVYENDFSMHNGKVNSGRILMVFSSIVSQLAKPNEKFMYGAVREGGRARDFEEAIEWLILSMPSAFHKGDI